MGVPVFFLALTGVMSAMAAYVGLRLIWPLPLGVLARLAMFVFTLLCANKMILLRWLAPGGMALKLPYTVLLVTSWLHTGVVLMFCVGLLFDIIGLVFRKSELQIFTPVSRMAVVGILGMSLAGLGIWNTLIPPQMVEMDAPVRHLPPDLDGFRIALIADTHIGPIYGREWAQTVTDLTNAAKPDLIAIAGDVVDGTPDELASAVAPFSTLKAKYGVYTIPGNHEYYSGLDPWRKAFPEMGMHFLYNQHDVIAVSNARLVVAGVADRVTLRGFPGEPTDLNKALAGAPEGPDVTRVLLDHQPSGAADNAGHGIDVQLSGHTHGGLALPIQPLVAALNGGFVSGQYAVNNMRLVVTNGAGLWAGMPLRLGVPSQIVMVRLVPAL